MDQQRFNHLDQVPRIPGQRIWSFLALSIISLSVTIYQIKLNKSPIVNPPYVKEKSLQMSNISSRILQTVYGSNTESSLAHTGLETINGCSEVSIKDKDSYHFADSCIDKKANTLRTAKRNLVRSVSSNSYSRYKNRKGETSVPLNIYHLAPKIFNQIPGSFLDQYQNPCWMSEGNDLYCLPYFYVIGMPKCGSSDLFDKLTSHHQIIRPKWKEPGFWTKLQYIRKPHDLSIYMEYFNSFREAVSKFTGNSTLITADGTVASMWSLFDVQFLNNGVGVGLPDILRAIQPKAKFFIILRDPVERLLSDYHYFGHFKRTPEDFHRKVLIAMQEFKKCMRSRKNELACIGIERTWTKECMTRVSLGVYSVMLRHWFNIFPANQLFVVSLTQWESNCVHILSRAYRFLSLDALSDDQLRKICSKRKVLAGKGNKVIMKNSTREILNCFYAPYKEDLKRFSSSHVMDEWYFLNEVDNEVL